MKLRTKQQTAQHLIDAAAQDLLRASLPRHWVLREYRPDYGLDFAVEVFRQAYPSTSRDSEQTFETLGEHVFLQLKGCRKPRRKRLPLYDRQNVEKTFEQNDRREYVGTIDVIAFPLDVAELLTIQRMGSALPVLLVVADLSQNIPYFVCLNDYIDKVLLAAHRGDYTGAGKRTVLVPAHNIVAPSGVGLTAFRWYAKRPKLFAAFQKFVYQHVELQYALERKDYRPLARHFALLVAQYDFWDDTEMWEVIPELGAAIRRFIETGTPSITKVFERELQSAVSAIGGDPMQREQQIRTWLAQQEILELWRRLALLPRNYEDVCREWFLPTPLGFLSSC